MKEKIFNSKEKYIFFTISIFLIVYLSFMLSAKFRAKRIYEELATFTIPDVGGANLNYYRQALKSISKAIELDPGQADYYAKKGDYLLAAKGQGLEKELSIDKTVIEDLYNKAIILDPTDFDYHLRLGKFYTLEGDDRAKSELVKATQLYPKDPTIYAYLFEYYLIEGLESELIKAAQRHPENPSIYLCLSKYYFLEKRAKEAFLNLVSFFNYQKDKEARYLAAQELGEKAKDLEQLDIDFAKKRVTLMVYPQTFDFSFKEQGFSKLGGNLDFKVYAAAPTTGVTLYEGLIPQDKFRMIQRRDEPVFYSLRLKDAAIGDHLSDLTISTNDGTAIEKIEIIKSF